MKNRNIYISLFLGAFLILLTGCNHNPNTEENDMKNFVTVKTTDFSVTAKQDGFYISRKNVTNLRSIGIHVKSDDTENIVLEADLHTPDAFYPFVSAEKEYTIWLEYIDQNWSSTVTDTAIIKALGGSGDYYLSHNGFNYNNNEIAIDIKDFKITRPEISSGIIETFSGNVWYDLESSNIWGSPAKYSSFPYENGRFDVSSVASVIANTTFFFQINYYVSCGNNNYSYKLIDNWQNPFSDSHPVKNISADKGIMKPLFSPAIKDYEITGTTENVILTPELFSGATCNGKTFVLTNKQDSKVSITAKTESTELTYNFTFIESEQRTFEGVEYLQTFYDDFDGTELNKNYWRKCPEQERQPNMKNHGWWSKECSYVKDGNLVLENKVKDGMNLSGAIDTEQTFWQSHGMYEIKFKCDYTSGMWYAFWLMGQNDEAHIGNGATDAAEIDCFELIPNENNADVNSWGRKNLFATTIHWDAYGASHKSKGTEPASISDDFYENWHIAQFVWGEKSYQLYLDGKLLWNMDASVQDEEHFGGMCNGKNYMIISAEFGDWGGDIKPDLLPAHMYVDYVKAYIQK